MALVTYPTTPSSYQFMLKDTHKEKQPANNTTALTKSRNMGIWVIGTSNQLFIRGSWTETNFSRKWNSNWQDSVPCDRFILYSPFCLPWHWLLIWQFCMEMMSFNLVLSTKNSIPVFRKRYSFSLKSVSKLKYWNRSKFPDFHMKHADLANGALFWKSLVPFFRRVHALLLALNWNF